MALDFQIEPFFDDYSEDKKFYRILFRPSYAVQARELTQLQTILQEQIRRHGDHIFKEGSMVIPGQISYDLDVQYVKLESSASNISVILENLLGREIQNSTGLKAKVIKYTTAEGSDPNTIYVKYLNSVQSAGVNVSQFSPLDVLSPSDGTTGLSVSVADVAGPVAPVGKSCIASIQRGVYYIKKNFVLVTDQSIVLDKYNNSPSYRVGLKLEEDIVYPEQDESLLDNALGSPNYAAPGAARYYMDLVLTKLSLTSTTDDDFIDLLRLKDGKVLFKIDRSQYAELEKTLARRTYDESGDYSLAPFGIQIREYRNNLRGSWSAGEKYIQGDIVRVVSGVGFNYFVAVQSGISGSSTPSWSTSAASINDGGVVWEYEILPKFNQGIYSFPSGDTSYSAFTLNDHTRLDGMLAIGIEPSKAYVRGYEIEKLTTEYLPVEKCRDLPVGSSALVSYLGVDSLPASTSAVSQSKTVNIDVSMGSYIIVESVLFAPALTTLTTVNLHDVLRASASSSSIIGQARVRGIELHTGTQYKVFLFDIVMRPGRNISEVKSIWNNSTSFMANAVQTGSPAVTTLYNPERSSLLYQLPDYAIKNISEVTYSVMTTFTQNSNVSGVVSSISPPSGYSFESVFDAQNYVVINNSSGAYVSSPTLSLSAGLLSVSGLTASTSHTIIATVKRSDAVNALSLAEVTDYFENFTSSAEAVNYKLVLDKSYVIRIVSVMMDSRGFNVGGSPIYDTNITARYTFNNGQTNSSIYFSELNLVQGAPLPTGSIRVSYEYLDITTNTPGDFLGVNSYTHASSKMRYDQIGAFGRQQLRDCLDFRPFTDGANFATKYFPKFGTTASIKYTHYLPRVDNVSLASNGRYIVSSGIPSLSAIEPNAPNSSMKLARLSFEPYTFNTTERSVAIDRVENKRYTMKDIGKLERRIEDLEYYTSLSLLELETKNTKIIDSNGLDRLQNGFIVDTFDGQGVGNAVSSEWNASIDSSRKELRPFFSQKQVNLLENVLAPTRNYRVSGDLVTLPYSEVALITQNKASKTENVNPYALYSWNGIVALNPWSDTWFSTERRPDIILNDEGQYNAVVAKAEAEGVLGTIWNSWQTVFSSARSLGTRLEKLAAWSTANNEILNDTNNGGTFWRNRGTFTNEELNLIGVTDGDVYGAAAQAAAGTRVLTIETQAVETTSARSGVRTFIVDKVDSRVLEDRVVETRVVPYIRSRSVLFTGFGFKPLTRLYGFFDGVNVDSYITSATRLTVSRILKPNTTTAYYPHTFDVVRNAGSAVQNAERLVTNSGTEDVEIAFNHGEVLKEYVGGVATGRSAIVVGQEVVGTTYYVYVMNIKGGTGFSTASNAYLEGEYIASSGDKPRVKFSAITTYSTLISSATGMIFGIYKIPNNPIDQFRTGVRELKFTDSPSNNDTDKSTSGSSYYEANGLIEVKQRTIISTRTAELVSTQVSETNTLVTTNDRLTRDTGWFDPLAQTFMVQQDGGAFLTSVDLYFSTVDQNVPVRVEIREVVNGYPGSSVLPFSRVELRGSSITTSTDASVATNFKFNSPVYLQNGVEYALVVLSDSNSYRIWISETDTIDVLTGNRISSQPYNGVLFKSQNGSAWTADQTQDMKFVLYRANFTTAPVELELIPPTLGYKNLDFNPFNFVTFDGATWTATGSTSVVVTYNNHGLSNGEKATVMFTASSGTNATSGTYTVSGVTANTFTITNPVTITGSGTAVLGSGKIRVSHRDHGMIAGDKVKFIARQVISSINGIPAAELFNVNHDIIYAETDAYVIEVATPTNAAGQAGGSYIAASENYDYQTAMIDIAQTAVPGCTIDYTITNIDSTEAVSTYSIIPKENLSFDESKVLPSSINYVGNALVVKAKLTTTNSAISPVIDLGRSAITLISNKIDDPSIADNDNDLDLFTVAGSTEIGSGKPITRTNNTLIVNSTTQLALYNAFDELNPGNVIRLTYSGVIGFLYMEVVNKYYDSTGNIYIETELIESTISSVSSIVDTSLSQTVNVVWMSHYNTEVSNGNGSVTSKYVTKKINLSRPSQMLRVMFSAIVPTEAEVEVYYKTGLNASGDFEILGYKKAPTTSFVKSSSEFTDIMFDIENLDSFDTFMVKLAMRSSSKAAVPRIRDLRVIACAA